MSYKKETNYNMDFSFEIGCMRGFSEHLSKLSGIDFSRVLADHSDEFRGLLSYLSRRKDELRKERFSEVEISAMITLNLISSLSLWYGFSKFQGRPDIHSEPAKGKNNTYAGRDRADGGSTSEYSAGIVIPTNLAKADRIEIMKLEKLIASLSSWKRLAGIWIAGDIPDQILSTFKKFKGVEMINVEDDRGPARARNLGIERALEADSDLIIFMDDDVVDPINGPFESMCGKAVAENDIYTPKIQSYGDTCFDFFHDVDGTLNGVYEEGNDIKSLVYGTTCVMICPRKILQEGLRFDEDFPLAAGEDIDFCMKARNKGHRIIPADSVTVQHDYGYDYADKSLMRFISRFMRYGEGNGIIRERQPQYFSSLTSALRRPTQLKNEKSMKVPDMVKKLSMMVERCMH